MKYTLGKVKQIYDGEWFNVRKKNWVQCCCDCGLTHRFNFKIIDGKIKAQAFRDKTLTRQRRKKLKT